MRVEQTHVVSMHGNSHLQVHCWAGAFSHLFKGCERYKGYSGAMETFDHLFAFARSQ